MMEVKAETLLGTTVDHYRIDRLIGEGGFAWVFAGTDTETGRDVALKVLKPRYAGDPQFEPRFRNESEVAAQLHHPNIVSIHGTGHEGPVSYLAMDLYPDSLSSLLERSGPLPEQLLMGVALQICGALRHAHEQGVIHRDLKVDNIMFRSDGTAVLADFGIARAVSGYATATGANMTIGTPHYVSPEQAQGRKLDGRSDLYALGVTLYKACTGNLPFRSSDWFELARMHVEVPPESPRKTRPEISRRFERIILKCLAKHPDDRYESAAALEGELQEIARQSRATETFGVMARKALEKVPGTGSGVWQEKKWLRRIVALVALVAIAALVMLLGQR